MNPVWCRNEQFLAGSWVDAKLNLVWRVLAWLIMSDFNAYNQGWKCLEQESTVGRFSAGFAPSHGRNARWRASKDVTSVMRRRGDPGDDVGDIFHLCPPPAGLLQGRLHWRRDGGAHATLNHSLRPPCSSSSAELHHNSEPSADLRNSVNVDLYLWAVLKVYYNWRKKYEFKDFVHLYLNLCLDVYFH